MKHFCTGLALLCSAYAVSAQPDCSQILNVGFSFGTQGNTVVLNNGTQTEFPNATTYKWDFGDGELSTDPNATHVYDLPGTYLVCLYGMVENCMDSVCQEVVITGGENPCDDLSADFTVTTQGVVVVFDASGPATGYHWIFGDGMQSFDSDPVHTYPEPGTYHACLVTWAWNPQTQDTCYAEHCEWVTIGDSSPCDDLVADFTVTTQGPVAAFNGYGGTAVGYLWYFGDNTQGDGSSPTHTYPGPGSYNACLLTWAWNSNTQDTCWAEYCEEITIDGVGPCDGLHAGFSFNTFPFGAQFSNSTTGTGFQTAWTWSFGDGTTSNDAQPVHTYSEPGTYITCLTVTSIFEQQGGGVITCLDSICQEIHVQGQGSPCDDLIAAFEVTTQGNMADFTASGGSAVGYHWNFGDGTEGDGPAPMHTYPEAGSYHACLVTWAWNPQTQDTCYAEHCEWVTIGGNSPCDGLQAGFQAQVGDVTVWFSNTTIGTGFQTSWHWDFGDGTTSDDAQPSHVFPGLGTYEVCLTVVTLFEQQGGGVITCQDSYCSLVSNGGGSPCDSLIADFTVTTQGNTATFSAVGGTAVAYHWNFGDGTEEDGPSPAHTYPEAGSYHACLVTWAWDPQTQDTCYAEHCEWVTIGDSSPCDDLVADFTVTTQGPVAAFNGYGGTAVGYLWSFGDNTQGDGPSPTHTYPGPGSYNACLLTWAWNSNTQDTCWAEYCEEITIDGVGPCDGLHADFEADADGSDLYFYSTSTGTGFQTSVVWSFGDGTTSTEAQPVHTYPEPGFYVACLTITSSFEQQGGGVITCTDSICQEVHTQGAGSPCELLNPGFEADVIDEPSVSFTSLTQGTGFQTSYLWSFGDGTTGDGAQTVHTYAQPGTYLVCLTVTSLYEQQGGGVITCTDSACIELEVQVQDSLCNDLNADFESDADGQLVYFSNTSTGTGFQTGLTWFFGDGTTSNDDEPVHTYPEPGTYIACLTVISSFEQQGGGVISCMDTICHVIDIPLGLNGPAGSGTLDLWPQPFEDHFTLKGTDLSGMTRFTLFEMTGQLVDDRSVGVQGLISLEYGHLSSGSYLLRIRNDHLDRTVRLLKR